MDGVLLYKEKLYLFDGKSFSTVSPKEAKKYKIGALIPVEDIRTLTFKLPKNLDEERLAIQIELKMYNEAGLDPEKEYAIDFISYDLPNEENYLIEAFALSKEDADAMVGEMVSKIGFLDILFPRFIAYKSLYIEGSSSNDLIIYIGDDEAFGVVYQKGRYIGYRALDSLAKISKKIGIELARLKEILATKGLVQTNYPPSEIHIFDALQEHFYKVVEKLVYAINHKRSYYGLEGIDRIILDFEGHKIEGLKELFMAQGVAEEGSYELLECCGLDAKQSSLAVAARYVAFYDQLDQRINLTFYERRLPFYRYEIFRYLVASFVAMIGVGAVIWYLSLQESELESQLRLKQQRLSKLKSINKKLLAKIKTLQSQKQELNQKLAALQQEIEIYEETLDSFPLIEEAKLERQKMINDVVEDLYIWRLSTKLLEQNGTKKVTVDLVSTSDQRDKIAKFMKDLLKKGYKRVQTKQIERQKNLYESRVGIEK